MNHFVEVAFATLLVCSMTYATTSDNVSSRLMVHIPHKLFKAEGYNHREALFGVPPYGGSISTNMYHVRTKLCDTQIDPYRVDEGWPSPFILMIDRGGCSFVKKVRNAQRIGAAGVVIADNTCLCSDTACIENSSLATCEKTEPIMADDGSGSDITIPSFLMFKNDADIIKAELKELKPVQIEMAWNLPAPDDRVEYDMWSVPTDAFVDHNFVSKFKDVAAALGKQAYFTPHMYIYDGEQTHCHETSEKNQCGSLCTNGGRYCATDPDNDLEKGISGADVVKESLRRLCIWEQYGSDDGIGLKYWDYVIHFTKSCSGPDQFMKDECVHKAYKSAAISAKHIEECMDETGGLTTDKKNSLLDQQLQSQKERGIVILPTVVVNSAAIRGALTVGNFFDAICAGFAIGTKPDVCKRCDRCDDPSECIKGKGVCKAGGNFSRRGVPMLTFVTVIMSIVGTFVGVGVWYYKKTGKEMRSEVRGILAEYMPLEDDDMADTQNVPDTTHPMHPSLEQLVNHIKINPLAPIKNLFFRSDEGFAHIDRGFAMMEMNDDSEDI